MDTTESFPLEEEWRFPKRRAYAGDVLYTEGMAGDHLYIIKEGEVDLSLVREEKQVVVTTLGRGEAFGMMPQLLNGKRTTKAVARSYCELYVVDASVFLEMLGETPKLVRKVLGNLAKRCVEANEVIATRVNYQPDLMVYANLLQLLGAAGGQKAGKGSCPTPNLAGTSLSEVLHAGRALLGHSEPHIRQMLNKFVTLHLVRIEDEKGEGKRVVFDAANIVTQTRQMAKNHKDEGKLDYEYISAGEFADLVEVERAKLLKKLAQGDFTDELFLFRKSEVMRLLDERGRKYFVSRQIKKPQDFSDINDLEFADQKSIYEVLTKFDVYDLSKVLKLVEEAEVREKILASMPRSKREDLEDEFASLESYDAIEAGRLAQQVVDRVKERMLKSD